MTASSLPVDRPPTAADRNPLGIASFAAAVAAVLVGGAVSVVQATLVGGAVPLSTYGVVAAIRGGVIALIALVAVVLGIIALVGRSPRKAFAAAGTGIGAVQLVDLLFSGLFTLVATAR